jgi:hypothetical protein
MIRATMDRNAIDADACQSSNPDPCIAANNINTSIVVNGRHLAPDRR